MTITKEQVTQWARECGTPYVNRHFPDRTSYGFDEQTLLKFAQLAYEAGKSAASEPVQGVEMPEPVAWIEVFKHGGGEHRWERRLVWKKPAVKFPAIHGADALYTLDQCQHAVAAAVARERQRILQCYSPDDTVNDYQDKIRSGK